jgi:hypothetical protein
MLPKPARYNLRSPRERVDVADQPWTETTATVAACEEIKRASGSSTRRGAELPLPAMPRYAVTFTYQANGQEYSGKYIVHEEVVAGHTFAICYDPQNPENNSGSENSFILHPKLLRLVTVIAVLLLLIAKHWFQKQ